MTPSAFPFDVDGKADVNLEFDRRSDEDNFLLLLDGTRTHLQGDLGLFLCILRH